MEDGPKTDRNGAAPGDVIGRMFVVERVIGEGASGVVFSARHRDTGRRVAIKIAHTPHRDILRSTRAMMELTSEHTVRVHEIGETPEGLPWMAMELLQGQDLAAVMAESGPLAVDDALRWAIQACEALAEAHERGLFHRGVKPSNLFLVDGGRGAPGIRVLDFAMSSADLDDAETQSTRPGQVPEAIHYLAPEQLRGGEVDARTDVWSVGATLHRLVTGEHPFRGQTIAEVCAKILGDSPVEVRRWRPDAPAGLEILVQRCLARSARSRFQDMADLIAALRNAREEARETPVVIVATSPTTTAEVAVIDERERDTARQLSLAPVTPLVPMETLAEASRLPDEPEAPPLDRTGPLPPLVLAPSPVLKSKVPPRRPRALAVSPRLSSVPDEASEAGGSEPPATTPHVPAPESIAPATVEMPPRAATPPPLAARPTADSWPDTLDVTRARGTVRSFLAAGPPAAADGHTPLLGSPLDPPPRPPAEPARLPPPPPPLPPPPIAPPVPSPVAPPPLASSASRLAPPAPSPSERLSPEAFEREPSAARVSHGPGWTSGPPPTRVPRSRSAMGFALAFVVLALGSGATVYVWGRAPEPAAEILATAASSGAAPEPGASAAASAAASSGPVASTGAPPAPPAIEPEPAEPPAPPSSTSAAAPPAATPHAPAPAAPAATPHAPAARAPRPRAPSPPAVEPDPAPRPTARAASPDKEPSSSILDKRK